MQTPLVDVGMPAHGRPVFLAEAVESVLAQSHRNWRLLVLDDSQGPEIGEALSPYLGDDRIEHRTVQPFSATGVMSALMSEGRGDYFAHLHDDDRWGPAFLERRVRFLEQHPECGFVFSGHVDINARGEVTGYFPARYPEGIVPHADLITAFQRRNEVDTMHSVLTRRSALEAVGAHLDEAFPRLYDWELWLRLSIRFPVGSIEETDVDYRAHEEQMSARPGKSQDFRAMFEHAWSLAGTQGLELPEAERRRLRARLGVSEALDHIQAHDARRARRSLVAALRTAPSALLDRRVPAALLALLGGRHGRAALARLRTRAWRHRSERRWGER